MAWDQHRLENYFLNFKSSDVTMCVTTSDGISAEFPGHRFLLSSRSPVFEKMLESNTYQEGRTGIVNINVEGGLDVARAFIRFFYSGDVQNKSLTQVLGLLKTSHLYQVDELISKSEVLILDALTPDNVCLVYESTKAVGSDTYIDKVISLILKLAFIIFQKSNHLDLSEELMELILKSNSLNVPSENHVADALWKWGNWNGLKKGGSPSTSDIRQKIQDLSRHVRWNFLQNLHNLDGQNTWKPLAKSNAENQYPSRASTAIPSIIKFSQVLDLFHHSQNLSCKEWKYKQRDDILLKFSTDKNVYLTGLELNFMNESSITEELSISMELQIDDRGLMFYVTNLSTLGIEMMNKFKSYIYTCTIELDSPVLLDSISSHVLVLNTLCKGQQVQLLRYDIGRGFAPLPRESENDETHFIIHEKILSVMKLYFVPALV